MKVVPANGEEEWRGGGPLRWDHICRKPMYGGVKVKGKTREVKLDERQTYLPVCGR